MQYSSTRYPKKSRQVVRAYGALHSVDGLRCEIDNVVGRDCKGLDDKTLNQIYYRTGRETPQR